MERGKTRFTAFTQCMMQVTFNDFCLQAANWVYTAHVLLTIRASLFSSKSLNRTCLMPLDLFIYLGFYVAFNTVQVISRWVVGRAE